MYMAKKVKKYCKTCCVRCAVTDAHKLPVMHAEA